MQQTESRRSLAAAGFGACAVATAILALTYDSLPYGAVCAAAIAIQIAVCVVVWASIREILGLCVLLTVSWSIFFTARMIAIMYFTDPIFDHESVVSAPDEMRAEIWVGMTAGLVVLACAMAVARGLTNVQIIVDPTRNVDTLLRLVAAGGILAYGAAAMLNLSSGLLSNVFQLYLFAIAALTYRMVGTRKVVPADVGLIAAAIVLGSVVGFKEPSVMAVLAVMVGFLATGPRVRVLVPVLAIGALSGLLVFSGVQAQRIDYEKSGAPTSPLELPGRMLVGLTNYDLAHGVVAERSTTEILLNPINGVLGRVRGTDALFAIQARTPAQIPFQGGASIVGPIITTIPFVKSVWKSEFTQLSLGRYYNINFWSYRPELDASSQGMSMPGDLYLNWGWGGVITGLALFGGLVGWVDRRFPARSALGAGLFAYAFLPLLSLDRNVAYQLFTLVLRTVIALVFIRLVGGTYRSDTVGSELQETPSAPKAPMAAIR